MRLLRSTAIIASLTLVSRLLGFVRDVLIANFFGAGFISDAFFTAFKLPNVFRRMFAEGAFNAAFVPLYAKRLEQDGEASADNFASETASVLFFFVACLVIAFELTMPFSLNIIGNGLDKNVNASGITTYDLAVVYAQITMPYLLFMSMTAMFSGVLNTRGFFALSAGVPIILNLFMISALMITPIFDLSQRQTGYALTAAISLSGVAQMMIVYWGCRRAGVRIRPRLPRLTPGVRRMITLGVPGLISAGITQINLVVSHGIATQQEGAASWLTYADRLYQLPLGMIGIAMGVALLPALSRRLRAGDEAGANRSMNRGMEIAAFLTLPAAFALFIIPEFLISGLFERGDFTASTTQQVSKALRFFALGLPAFVLIKVLTPAFFARENMRTPMYFAGLSALINVSLGLFLFWKIGFEGLALATTIAAWVNVAGLGFILLRDKDLVLDARLLSRFPRIVLASAVMGFALWATLPIFPDLSQSHIIIDLLSLIGISGFGLIIYAIAASLLRAFGLHDIRDALSKKAN
ncbi:MAG: murein biosynthesis integral membrane protein MurJ [Litorimonas sp.]